MTNEATVIVEGYFGKDKEVTRKEFVSQWKHSVTGLFCITVDTTDHARVVQIVEDVAKMADTRFNELLDLQS